jgi:hypothetical protein
MSGEMGEAMRSALVGLVAAGVLGAAVGAPATARTLDTAPAAAMALQPDRAPDRVLTRALARPTTAFHFTVNVKHPAGAHRVGFNVFDTGTSAEQIAALPSGSVALVWLGQKCPTAIDHAFRQVVRGLASNDRVFGYFLSDEPHIADCPLGPAHLAQRAGFIRKVSDNRQKSLIVMSATVPSGYHAFRPKVTRVSMVGIDPYPCSIEHPRCDDRLITLRVRNALHAGIRRSAIVPTFQTFGQESLKDHHYYNLPTPRQLKRILNTWAKLVPHPKMDASYGWGHQNSANPSLVDANGLQDVLHRYFRG